MLTVSELAICAIAPGNMTLYYTRIGLSKPTALQQNGHRLFAPTTAARLRFTRRAKELGFTLKEIAEIIRHAEYDESLCGEVCKIIHQQIVENRINTTESSISPALLSNDFDRVFNLRTRLKRRKAIIDQLWPNLSDACLAHRQTSDAKRAGIEGKQATAWGFRQGCRCKSTMIY